MTTETLGNIPMPAADAKPGKPTPKTLSKANYVKILLEENDDIPPTGLFVGVNGTGYLLRPGEEMLIPPSVVEVLEHAVHSMPQIDPQTRQVVGYRERMRFPFRYIQ